MSGRELFFLISRIPPKVMLLTIILFAVGAGILVEVEMQKKDGLLAEQQRKNAHKDMAQVLVAARDIPEGVGIPADALRLETVESGRLPLGALQAPEAALGLQAKVAIHGGECILSQNLQVPQGPKGFESKIPEGFRAVTFPVDSSTGVAGFLEPDCHVDILAQTGAGAESSAVPILSDVRVVAVGQTYQKRPGQSEAQPSSCVTVAVVPEEGQRLINAMSSGKLYCLMRNQKDRAPLAVRDISAIFPKPAKASANDLELSSTYTPLPTIPAAVAPTANLKLPPDEALPRPLHSVEIWSANKKDALSFPQD